MTSSSEVLKAYAQLHKMSAPSAQTVGQLCDLVIELTDLVEWAKRYTQQINLDHQGEVHTPNEKIDLRLSKIAGKLWPV